MSDTIQNLRDEVVAAAMAVHRYRDSVSEYEAAIRKEAMELLWRRCDRLQIRLSADESQEARGGA